MALRKLLTLRRPQSGRLEGHSAPIQPIARERLPLHPALCRPIAYYVGTTRSSLEQRVAEHSTGTFGGYTSSRRPLILVFSEQFERIEDAVAAERQIKGWRCERKEALIRGDYSALPTMARRGAVRPSRRGQEGRSSG
jgi:putative endonuclease